MKDFINQNYHLIIYVFIFLSSLAFTFLMNSLFLRFFHTLGIRNRNDGTIIRWGTMSKPAVGGLSFYIMFLLSLASYSIFFNPNDALFNSQFMGFIIAMAVGFLAGLADDAYDTKPVLKFLAQVMCGVCLVFTGTYIQLFDNMIVNYFITVFWVVGIMNSVNMLDNMDGITASVSAGILLSAIVTIVSHGDVNNLYLIALIGLLAAIIGFLFFNWHPSKMYMGDTGSQFLGVFLAAIGIMFFWNNPYAVAGAETPSIKKVIIPLIAFILPIVDTTIVVTNRLSRGRSPFVGGKDHTTHSLAYMGLNDRQVGWIFVGMSVVSIILVYIINRFIDTWSDFYSWLFLGYFSILVSVLFYTTNRIREKRKQHTRPEAHLKPSHL